MIFAQRCLFIFFCVLSASVYSQRSPVAFGTAAEGRIVPGEGLVAVAAPAPGGAAIVTKISVKAGDTVKRGDVLATLEGQAAAQAAVKVAEAQEQVAQAGLKVARARQAAAQLSAEVPARQKAVWQAGVAEAQAGVLAAQKAMAQALAEHDAALQKIHGQIAEYQRIIVDLDPPRKDREDLLTRQNMLKLEIASLSQTRASLEAQLQAKVAQAQAAVESAQAQLAVAEVQVQSAQAEAGVAQAQAEYQAQRELGVATESLARAQIEARAFEVRAPMDGSIIAVNAQPGESVGPEGIFYMGDLSKMFVEAQIYIDDISRVKVGQTATISGPALSEGLTGTVAEVGMMVSPANLYTPDPTVFTDRRVVPVRIALNDSAKAAKLIYAQVTVKIAQSAE